MGSARVGKVPTTGTYQTGIHVPVFPFVPVVGTVFLMKIVPEIRWLLQSFGDCKKLINYLVFLFHMGHKRIGFKLKMMHNLL